MAPAVQKQHSVANDTPPESADAKKATSAKQRRRSSGKPADAHNTSDERVNNLSTSDPASADDEPVGDQMDASPASAKRKSPAEAGSDDEAENVAASVAGKKQRRDAVEEVEQRLSPNIDRLNASMAQSASLAAIDTTFQDADGFLPGSIRRINVKNFMCHDNLTIDFLPRINFVTGRNGSGKSAILTAMVLALGGSASNTNRGSSMKTFVRTGSRRAEIIISVVNVGPDAFEPEKYGARIEIVRGMAADGAAPGYRIKSAGGRVVATKRETVRSIADRFNLPVSSPLCIMNQDTSRTFLKNVDSHAMYSLFIRALQLDIVNVDLQNVSTHRARMSQLAKPINEKYKTLKDEKKDLEKKLEAFVSIEEKRTEFRHAKHRLEWAIVSTIEQDIEEDAGKIQVEHDEIEKLEQSLQKIPEKRKDIVDKMGAIDDQIAMMEEEMAGFSAVKQQKESAAREVKKKYDVAGRAVARHDDALQSKKNQADSIGKKVEDLRKKDGSDVVFRQRLEIQEKIKALHDEGAEEKEQEKHLEAESIACRRAVVEADNDLKVRAAAVESDIRKLKGMESQLSSLKRARTSAFAVYGESMARLKDEIKNRASEFQRIPIGPLGAYIRVRNPVWSCVVEQSLGNNLKAFLVTSRADEALLQKCMQSVRMHRNDTPLIICGRFGDAIYDYERDKPYVRDSSRQSDVGEFSTLLDMLDVPESDDRIAVVNCLIDQVRAVQTVLMNTMAHARDACMNRWLSDTASRIFDLSGNTHIMLPAYKFYANNTNQKAAKYLIRDNAEAIAQTTEELANQELVVQAARETLATARAVRNAEQQKLNDVDNRLKACKAKMALLLKKISKLEAEMPDEPAPATSIITEMETKLETIQQEIATISADKREAKIELDELNEKLKDAYAEVTQYEINENAKLGEKAAAEASKASFELQLEKVTRAVRKGAEQKQAHKAEIERLKNCVGDMRNKIEERLSKLADEQQTERPDPTLETLPLDQLKKLMLTEKTEFLDLKSRVELSRGLKEEELRERSAIADLELRELKEQYSYVKFVQTNVESIVRNRLKHMTKVIKRTTEYVSSQFRSFLETRDFKGKLNVDHHERTLTLQVQPPHRRAAGSQSSSQMASSQIHGGDVRQLSGGERSYAMVSLISAMWMHTDMPIRMIDEFDVFMDPVNRTFALSMLVSAARDQQKQFVFLTPLALPTGILKPGEHPIVMPEPRPENEDVGRSRAGRKAQANVDQHNALEEND